MALSLGPIGQIALNVSNVDRAEEFFGAMTFFTDPDGHMLALMMEAPKGYQPSVG